MEKIDIYVPEEIGLMLEHDAKTFEIFKNDRKTNKKSINRNKFLSMLIIGYYNDYVAEAKSAKDAIVALIDANGISITDKDKIAGDILKKVILPNIPSRKGKNPKKFSLKPTTSTETLINQIDRDIGDSDFISQYFCRMFMNYCKKPFSQRERIIFKDKYDKLLNACESNQTINFRTIWNPNDIHEVIPYKIVIGSEEMFNYLLCAEVNPITKRQETKSYRLNRIHESIVFGVKTGTIDNDVKRHLDLMIKYGPAYSINDDEVSRVRLTSSGVREFERIYFGRPLVDGIYEHDGVIDYFFNCSKDQLFLYFRRFGNGDAEILSPASLRTKIIDFHVKALEKYKER